MNIALWIAQILLALAFTGAGSMKLFAFDKLAAKMPGAENQRGLFIFIGLCELAGALGLILPGVTGVYPILTMWAAIGLATILVFAVGFHLMRKEYGHFPPIIVLLLMTAFVIWGRY